MTQVTFGKDMVLRDLAQGAYRMRGIGKGQVKSHTRTHTHTHTHDLTLILTAILILDLSKGYRSFKFLTCTMG